MRYLIILSIVVLVGALAIQAFLTANPARLASQIKIVGGLIALAVTFGLMATGYWFVAMPSAALATYLLSSNRPAGFSNVGSSGGDGRQRYSTVRSAMLEMWLNHETGEMEGRVLAGQFEGMELSAIPDAQMAALHAEVGRDPESQALFEAYLDRRNPGWREDVEQDSGSGHGGTPHSGAMTDEEAYEVLGLAQGATPEDIRSAHRRLMKRLHPDLGGSDFLASKINEAKDRLLREHGSSNTRY